MDVDLIIANIIHFLPRSQIKVSRYINTQWFQIVSDTYPTKFIWNQNSELVEKISKENQFDETEFYRFNQVFCWMSGFEIRLIPRKSDRKVYLAFNSIINKKLIYQPLPATVKESSKLLHFYLHKEFSNDGLEHFVILLKYHRIENTFVDYTDLDNIMVFTNNNKYVNYFDDQTIHYALCQSLILYDFYINETSLADFEFSNVQKLSTKLCKEIRTEFATFYLNEDGSIFISDILCNEVVLINKHLDFVSKLKLPHDDKLFSYFACSKFVTSHHKEVVRIHNVFQKNCTLELPLKQSEYLCHIFTLTAHHFILHIADKNENYSDKQFRYFLVDTEKKTFTKVLFHKLFIIHSKVEQTTESFVIVHWWDYGIYRNVGVDLNRLCLMP